MDFYLTDDQKLIAEMVRDFALKEILPQASSLEDKHEFPQKLFEKLGELGVLGMSVPSQYGGVKTDTISLLLAIEELSRVMPSLAVIVSVHCSLFCYSILKFGNEEQKKKYLPKVSRAIITC